VNPLFTIITPSLQRESLVRCCETVNQQTLFSWQHIVQVDAAELDTALMERIKHPQREIYCCGERHGHFGNHCRHIAWEKATGLYCIYLDDDNTLAHINVLLDIINALHGSGYPQWACFPILRHGSTFFYDPPRLCFVDTLNIVVKREIGRWPDIEAREADGHWVDALRERYPYKAFPLATPIGIMEHSSDGV